MHLARQKLPKAFWTKLLKFEYDVLQLLFATKSQPLGVVILLTIGDYVRYLESGVLAGFTGEIVRSLFTGETISDVIATHHDRLQLACPERKNRASREETVFERFSRLMASEDVQLTDLSACCVISRGSERAKILTFGKISSDQVSETVDKTMSNPLAVRDNLNHLLSTLQQHQILTSTKLTLQEQLNLLNDLPAQNLTNVDTSGKICKSSARSYYSAKSTALLDFPPSRLLNVIREHASSSVQCVPSRKRRKVRDPGISSVLQSRVRLFGMKQARSTSVSLSVTNHAIAMKPVDLFKQQIEQRGVIHATWRSPHELIIIWNKFLFSSSELQKHDQCNPQTQMPHFFLWLYLFQEPSQLMTWFQQQ